MECYKEEVAICGAEVSLSRMTNAFKVGRAARFSRQASFYNRLSLTRGHEIR